MASIAVREGNGRGRVDWDAAFAAWVSVPRHERNQSRFAEQLGVRRGTLLRRMTKDRWDARTAAFDQQVREKLEAEGVRKLEERNRDSIEIIEVFRRRYAQRLVPRRRSLCSTSFARQSWDWSRT